MSSELRLRPASRSLLVLLRACAVAQSAVSSESPEHLSLLQTRAVSAAASSAAAEELLHGSLAAESEAEARSAAESESEVRGSRSQAGTEGNASWLNIQKILNGALKSKTLAAQPVSTEVVFTNTLRTVPQQRGSRELNDLVNATGLMEFGNETMEIAQTVTMNSQGTGWGLQKHEYEQVREAVVDKETAVEDEGWEAAADTFVRSRQAANWTRLASTGAVDLSTVTADAMHRKLDRIVEDSELVRDSFIGVKQDGSALRRHQDDTESKQVTDTESKHGNLMHMNQEETESKQQAPADRSDESAATPKSSATPKSLPALVFVKTHRTGSSTLANIVHRLGERHNMTFLLPSGEHDKNSLGWPGPFPGEDVANLIGQPVHNYDVICNNAVFDEKNMRRYLKPSPLFFTILRRPESQIESAFDFFKPPCGKSWTDRLAWLQDLRGQERSGAARKATLQAAFRNPQAHDLGWYQRASSTGQDDEAVHEWLAEVGEALNLVVLAEYFDEGLVLLRRRLGLELEDVVHLDMKRRAARPDTQPTKLQAAELRENLHVDDLLYNHFNHTFWRAWEREGGDEALREEVELLRRRSGELRKACEEGGDVACPWSMRADSAEYTEHLRAAQARLAVSA